MFLKTWKHFLIFFFSEIGCLRLQIKYCFCCVAWVCSIHLFALYAVAPFVTVACDLWGCRITAFAGGVLCVVGLVASSFVTQLYLLFLTYGVVFGIGASLAFITTFRIVSQWFKRSDNTTSAASVV